MFQSPIILCAAFAAIPLYLYFKSPRHSLPPGPKPLPFIGNLHQVPRQEPFKVYRQWARTYGPVMYFRIFKRDFIILDSLKAITDLFEKRSSRYSTRPRLVMAGELVGKDDTAMLFLKYGPKWRQTRQLVHNWLGQRNIEAYLPAQVLGSHRLLSNLLDKPEKFSEHLRTNLGSVILKLTYGIECRRQEDPWIAKSDELHKITAIASQPGRWLVDSFPILRFIPSFLPGAGFLRWAKKSRKVAFDLARSPYDHVKEKMASEDLASSFVHDRLSAKGGEITPQEEDALIIAAGSLYAGGMDTLLSVLRSFFMVMARYPEIQKRLQQEIDSVIGPQRLPQFEDFDSLPYVGCLIKELVRFNATAPLVPHSLDEDDVYEGYHIPKGTWVMANIWAVYNDPSIYHDPSTFNPDRFNPALGENVEMDPFPITFCVGLGRRFCPAAQFSLSILFINITNIISVFNILPPVDASGQEVVPPLEYEFGHIRKLKPFQCQIVPRSAQSIKLIPDTVWSDFSPTS
ncbi:cytochrome P450 [Macrolepiota fuliginosa MF-IS2]|uniref:Cytochrome P450 n=1 Tax=Macrolepiota fuliginosa MF-IS2 TaxID=1400762 RepID=A0A9P6C0M5_9AGAR|nr:cytochrome P450 [Macrolepiota fuliginosa MF-IS2]